MATAVAIGGSGSLDGFALVGVTVVRTTSDEDVLAAWQALDDDVALVVLSPEAALALGDRLDHEDRLTVVTP